MKKALLICTLIAGAFVFAALYLPTLQAQDEEALPERELVFETKPAMYAANEEWLTFACELPDGQVPIGSAKQIEMYYYSMYGLGNLLFRSGMGVHIVHNPLFTKHMKEDEGMPWYQKPNGNQLFFQHKLGQFVERTAADQAQAQFPPKGVYPVYLEYSSGVPAFVTQPELDDFNTLRWDPETMDKTMTPGAWGQAMMKQVLWARDFFTNHKTIDGVTYLGNSKDDGGNGFRGAALIAQAITKSFALKSELAYHAKTGELGGVDPATYDPAAGAIYYPHAYEVEFADAESDMPPKPKRFVVTDNSSHLFDAASLLWAQSEFYFITDPTVEDDYDQVFGDPKWNPNASDAELREQFKNGKTIFPMGPHTLSKGITAVNVKNLKALHFNPTHGTLVDRWHPDDGPGTRASMPNVGMAMVALANTHHHLHDAPPLKKASKELITAQADFLLKQQADDGSFADHYDLKGSRVRAKRGDKTLSAQTFAIRGLMAAHHVTKKAAYRDAAERAYAFMNEELWVEDVGVFRAYVGAERSTYDGLNFGSTIGALRELAIVREGQEQQAIVARLDSFFEQVAQRNGLQLAELGRTGESMPSPAERQEAMAKLERLMDENPSEAMKMKQQMADSDNDGVPKPMFVDGTSYGAAPVQARAITLATPR